MTTRTFRLVPLAAALGLALAACGADGAKPDSAAAPSSTAAAVTPSTDAASTAAPIKVASGTYVIDPTHTMVLAQWNHLGFSNPSANFADAKGEIVINGDDMSQSSVNVTLPLSGLSSFSKKFDEHMASSDLFDVGKFPEARFVSTKVESTGINIYKVSGDLTIKNVAKPVVLDVTLNGAGPHPMSQAPSVGFDATATVKRSDWGLEMAAPMVSDEVKLRITTEASQAAAPAEAATAQ